MLTRRTFLVSLLSAAAMSAAPLLRAPRPARADGRPKDAVVIGGGIAGLTAAYLLRSLDVLLLEAQPRFGGRAVGGVRNGWSYTKGAEYIGKPEGALAEIIDDLDLSLLEIPSPMDQIWRGGEVYDGDAGRIRLLVEHGGIQALNRLLLALRKVARSYEEVPDFEPGGEPARLDAITCAQWFRELDLPPVYADIYNVTFRGLFGANINEVSALGAFSEIYFDFEGYDAPLSKADLPELYREAGREGCGAYTFRTGLTEVTDGLAAALGDRARTSARVAAVGRDGELFTVSCRDNGQERTIRARSIVLATPLPVTLKLAPALLGAEQQALLRQVPYAQFVTAALFSQEPIHSGSFDLALPDGWLPTDVYDSTWMQKKLGEEHEGCVASLYLAPQSFRDQTLVSMSDERLLERAFADVQAIWPDIRTRVTGHDVHRFAHGYPVMVPGAFARLTRLHATLNGGLQLAGDGMVYPTFEAAADSGVLAAERVLHWLDEA